MALTWIFEVDWDGDTVFTSESDNMIDMNMKRGRQFVLKTDSSGFEEVKVGRVNITLNNLDGRYDPYNTESLIYPNVAPGCKFMLQVNDGATRHDVMTGNIAEISSLGGRVERVMVVGEDGGQILRKTEVSTAVLTAQGIDDAINAILAAAGWDGGSSLDSWTDILDYFWASGDSAWHEIDLLMDACIGRFFVAADGQAKYYSRLRLRPVVETLTEADIQRK